MSHKHAPSTCDSLMASRFSFGFLLVLVEPAGGRLQIWHCAGGFVSNSPSSDRPFKHAEIPPLVAPAAGGGCLLLALLRCGEAGRCARSPPHGHAACCKRAGRLARISGLSDRPPAPTPTPPRAPLLPRGDREPPRDAPGGCGGDARPPRTSLTAPSPPLPPLLARAAAAAAAERPAEEPAASTLSYAPASIVLVARAASATALGRRLVREQQAELPRLLSLLRREERPAPRAAERAGASCSIGRARRRREHTRRPKPAARGQESGGRAGGRRRRRGAWEGERRSATERPATGVPARSSRVSAETAMSPRETRRGGDERGSEPRSERQSRSEKGEVEAGSESGA